MRTIKIFLISLTVVTVVSCRKDGMNDIAFAEETPSAVINSTEVSKASLSAWKPVSNWNSVKKQVGTTWSGTIDDAAITMDIVNNGLVLVFAKTGNSGQSLLYMQAGNVYWYYQVDQGHITINTETVAGTASIDSNQSFQYVILSKEQLAELTAKAVTNDELISMSWEKANELFGK